MSKKIAVYGGSFDPPHNGHVLVVEKLAEIFDLVLVMPANVSPFKPKGASAASNHRLNMIKLAFKPSQKVQICDYELQKEGASYTIDTITHLKSLYAEDELFVVVGAENANKLHLWKDYDALKKLVTFYAVPIKCYVMNVTDAVTAPFLGPDISSSHCKVALSFNKADTLMNKDVIDYISANGLYTQYDYIAKSFQTFKLSPRRIQHSYLSAFYGILLAKLHGEDVEKAVSALLLHDIAKSVIDTDESKQYITDLESIQALPQPLKHSELGAQIAQKYFSITDEGILNAIRYHTTARPNMTRLEEIVFLADKLEVSRIYNGVEHLRDVAKLSLNDAMEQTIAGTVEKLSRTNRDASALTLASLEYYKSKSKEKCTAVDIGVL